MDNLPGNSIKADRLLSVDALRGFTMFMLVGGGNILRALPKISDNGFFTMLDAQMEHVPWEGFRFYDLIFPMFLFIIGVTLPFSYKKRLESAALEWLLLYYLYINNYFIKL